MSTTATTTPHPQSPRVAAAAPPEGTPGRPRRAEGRSQAKGRRKHEGGAKSRLRAAQDAAGHVAASPSPPVALVDPFDPATRLRWVEERCRLDGDPTPREIATRCLMIRAGWSADEERRRRGIRLVQVGSHCVQTYAPERNPLAAGMPGSARRRNGKVMARG